MKTVDTSWHDTFISTLTASGNIRAACKAAGVSRSTAYIHKDLYPEFGIRWGDALEDAIDTLELIARERAKVQSDTLLIFLLKAHRPEKYRDRASVEHSGKGGGPIVITSIEPVKPDGT